MSAQKKDVYDILDSDSDTDLKKAINMSLEELDSTNSILSSTSFSSSSVLEKRNPLKRNVVSVSLVSSDEDEEKLRRPPPETRKKTRTITTSVAAAATKRVYTTIHRQESNEALEKPSSSAVLIGDRKEMEELRLARVQEQKQQRQQETRSIPPRLFYDRDDIQEKNYADRFKAVPSIPVQKKQSVVDLESEGERLVRGDDGVDLVNKPASPSPPPPPSVSKTAKSDLNYPRGVVKKTWIANVSRCEDDIRIEEVLQKQTLVTAVLSSFQWDYEWILQLLPFANKEYNTVFVMHGKDPADREMKKEMLRGLPRIELVFPNMDGQVNCMHSKLMLLFHKKGDKEWLRIAVPTANMTDYDWGVMSGGVMENMVFVIDLPRLETPAPKQTFFLEELLYFCTKQDIPGWIIRNLVNYDFSETRKMAFVHTIGGSHCGKEWVRTGYCGLGRAVKRLGYHSDRGLEVDYVTSSLGAAREDFISNIYRAAQGHTGLEELQRRNKKPLKLAPEKSTDFFGRKVESLADTESTNDEGDFEEETDWHRIKDKFRVYFPSSETVLASMGGAQCAGTICFQRKWWNDKAFPKSLVKDCRSVRKGMLMHNKLLFARPAKTLNSGHGRMAAWAYIGSANLSESAWGKLVVDRSLKTPKLNCKNWECGVIIPVHAKSLGQTLSGKPVEQGGPAKMKVFEGTVPVPMQTPGDDMGGKQPWFFMEDN